VFEDDVFFKEFVDYMTVENVRNDFEDEIESDFDENDTIWELPRG